MSKKINLNGGRIGAFVGWPKPVGLVLRRELPEWNQVQQKDNGGKSLIKAHKNYSTNRNSRHRGE